MSARTLLDADMRTIAAWIVQAWRWWLQEVRSFVPASLQRSRQSHGPHVVYRDGTVVLVRPSGTRSRARRLRAGTHAIVLIPHSLCLTRLIMRPPLSDRDVHRMVALEADTLLPIPAGLAVLAGRVAGAANVPGKISVEVAGLPIEQARTIVTAVEAAGIVPLAIVSDRTAGDRTPLDFAPGMRALGLLADRRSVAPLVWALVGCLLLLNLAVWIWQDAAEVTRFEQIVAEQQPAVSIAQTITRRRDQDQRVVFQALSLRRSQDPLRIMAHVAEALPRGAWLQRYVWDGGSIRLVGYRPAKTDIATALRRSGRFAEVRSASDETQPAVPAGEPFDVTATIIR